MTKNTIYFIIEKHEIALRTFTKRRLFMKIISILEKHEDEIAFEDWALIIGSIKKSTDLHEFILEKMLPLAQTEEQKNVYFKFLPEGNKPIFFRERLAKANTVPLLLGLCSKNCSKDADIRRNDAVIQKLLKKYPGVKYEYLLKFTGFTMSSKIRTWLDSEIESKNPNKPFVKKTYEPPRFRIIMRDKKQS